MTMEDIETLLRISRGDKLAARLSAISMLGRTGDARAVEPLIALLQDSWMGVREAAARALGEIGDVRAVGPLCSILSAYSDGRAAAEALVKFGAAAVEPVAAVLAGKPDTVKRRDMAAVVLGLIGDARGIGPLIAALQFPIGLVTRSVEEALVRIGAPAVEALAAELREGKSRTAGNAADILVKIGTPGAIEALSDALGSEKEEVRKEAEYALKRIGMRGQL
jgi:HEAT repeat protein